LQTGGTPALGGHGGIPHPQKSARGAQHDRLAAAAKRHRRSLNNEAILCLEAGLRVAPPSEDRLVEIRALRQRLPAGFFDPAEIEGFRGEGRP